MTASSRFTSSTTLCARRLSSAFSVASISAYLSSAFPRKQSTFLVSIAACSSISPFSSTSHLLISSSTDVFPTSSSARPCFLQAHRHRSPLFLSALSFSTLHLDVRDPIHNRCCGPQHLRCFEQHQDRAFSLGSDVSASLVSNCHFRRLSRSFAVLGSGGIEGALVTADGDPPDVTSQNLPQTTKPCHFDPFTSSERYL